MSSRGLSTFRLSLEEHNSVFMVEKGVYEIKEGREPSEGVKRLSSLLGQPTKKAEVLLDRYRQVVGRYVEKKCCEVGGGKRICIYSPNPRSPFRRFQFLMHSTGTVILFEDDAPVKVLAFPIHKALTYADPQGAREEEYGDKTPSEVSVRIDGWQLTAYYNPVLNRWVFATRYVLHNMFYEQGRLVTADHEEVMNPYVQVADRIAEENGLYERLRGFEGWTFTFALEGPEPAVTRPSYPLGSDYKEYRLYLLMARDDKGRLYAWSESRRILGYHATPKLVKPGALKSLYDEVRGRLDVRSYIAYVDSGDPVNPELVELRSDLYPDAMMLRYLYNAKSTVVLAFEVRDEERLLSVVPGRVRRQASAIIRASRELDSLLEQARRKTDLREFSRSLVEVVSSKAPGARLNEWEVVKSLERGNTKRVSKKILSLLAEGRSLLSGVDKEIESLLDEVKRLVG